MFNFLDPKLLPKISCKSPSTDHYEVENLISSNYADKSRGFIAYPSIKPPVEIEIEFLCNINIFYIVLNTTVGNLQCSGIEIYAKTPNTTYVSISKGIFNNKGAIFCNSRKYSKENPPPAYNSDYFLCFFKSNMFRTFLNASFLKILIFKTEKSTPCLSSVEVWGQPSKACSFNTVQTVYKLMGLKNKTNNLDTPKTTASDDNFVVPDDFKDDLTHELMTIPYTLPSGHTIDQSTLEKHNKNEESFGRKPGDPFTGLKFNNVLKPILNVSLKSRIDMFLLQNSHRSETFGLKRSLRSCDFKRKKLKECDDAENPSSSGEGLDLLIQSVKDKKDFVSFVESENSTERTCILCENKIEYVYQLPCLHYYCRKCLLNICKSCICSKCNGVFTKNQVVKCET
ncbi:RING finger protein 37 [Sitophilus oryzae]|uniref:RING finger protein 37 n=1 Tax=Sitophilus oryzae TaxID=7048 RepID=A0A6J2YEQ9_SITOR|nr:RING finger protein 37 [Sitophilus oryzae]XP_030761900.1 RING finger protein 37 [Sitophilus oryzae]XP_030761901.1 RING finger protein 37 [Sitophilus oryzae]XP_030761902.1 RING finger protein 37 [Sitophilus oryzae]